MTWAPPSTPWIRSALCLLSFSTAKVLRMGHRGPFARSLQHALRLFMRAHDAVSCYDSTPPLALTRDLERAIKLLHITPALLQSSDGRCSRQSRYNEYGRGELGPLIQWLLVYANCSSTRSLHDTPEARLKRATKLAHERGGITKAANILTSPAPAPRDENTLNLLRSKHPLEDPDRIAEGKEEALNHTKSTSSNLQGIVKPAQDPFNADAIRAAIRKANPQSAPGPSGLRYCHLQDALCDDLVEDLAEFARLVFSSHTLPDLFWTLHTSANLSALGEKARPIACGDVLRRLIGTTFSLQHRQELSGYFEPWRQYGVGVSGGVEVMAAAATLGFQEGSTILTFDGANAFNTLYRHKMLPALAEIVPSLIPYATNLYARTPPKLLFAMNGRATEVIESARGVQQGCSLGPLCYSAGTLQALQDFRTDPPVSGARAMAFIDDITVILPPESARDMSAICKVTAWFEDRLAVLGIKLNRGKSKALLPGVLRVTDLTDTERQYFENTQLQLAEGGLSVVGVPVGTEDHQRQFVSETMRGEPAELLRKLVKMEDAQASFQILRLSAVSRMTFLLRNVPPTVTKQAASDHDALVEWALASIIAGEGAATSGLASPEEVRSNPELCKKQRVLGRYALQQAHLPIREGGLGLTSGKSTAGAAFIGGQALALARAVAAASTPQVQEHLRRLPERPMIKALVHELKEAAKIMTTDQLNSTVGTSWTALATSSTIEGREMGALLTEVGAREETARNTSDSSTTPGGITPMDEDNPTGEGDQEIVETTQRRRQGEHLGMVPGVQSKICQITHRKKATDLLHQLRTEAQDHPSAKRAFVRFLGARNKGAVAFVECQGRSHFDTMEPTLWREALGRTLGTHDTTTRIGGTCQATGCMEETNTLAHTLLHQVGLEHDNA